MTIKVSKPLPPVKDLVRILKEGLSDQYSYQLFGLGKSSILVGRSLMVGAQVTTSNNEISIISSPPSVLGGFLRALGMTELAIFIFPFYWFSPQPKYAQVEKEIASFLQHIIIKWDRYY